MRMSDPALTLSVKPSTIGLVRRLRQTATALAGEPVPGSPDLKSLKPLNALGTPIWRQPDEWLTKGTRPLLSGRANSVTATREPILPSGLPHFNFEKLRTPAPRRKWIVLRGVEKVRNTGANKLPMWVDPTRHNIRSRTKPSGAFFFKEKSIQNCPNYGIL